MNLLLFELKLILRNKRLKQFLIMSFMLVFVLYPQFINGNLTEGKHYILLEFFIIACFSLSGSYFAVFAFSMNGSFMEKLMTSPASAKAILESKYYFLCIISLIVVLLMLPCMFWGVKLFQLASAYSYVIGFVFFGFFYTALYSTKTLDIKQTSFYNWQGVSVLSYLLPISVILVATGIIAFIYWLFGENITYIAMSVVGIAFMATHKLWLKYICLKFEKTKYERLECFRESN
jgi:hypothetical protein